MTCSKRSFAVVSLLFAVLLSLSIGTLNARDADLASRTFAAAQAAKQQCINICRARYRECRRVNQVPSFGCRGVTLLIDRQRAPIVGADPRRRRLDPRNRYYINIGGNMTGSTIAQASPGAKQSVEFNLNVEMINEALFEPRQL